MSARSRPATSSVLSWVALLLALGFSVCCIALSISIASLHEEMDANYEVVLGLFDSRNLLRQVTPEGDGAAVRDQAATRLETLAQHDSIISDLRSAIAAAATAARDPAVSIDNVVTAINAAGPVLRDRRRAVHDALGSRWRMLTALAIASLALVAIMALLVLASRRAGFERIEADQVQQERIEADERLRDSEALFHSLVDHVPLSIFRKDKRGRFIFANQRFCEELGEPLEKIIGESDFEFFPKDLAQKYRADDEHVMNTGQVLQVIEEHTDPKGRRSFVEVIKSPVHDHRGRIIGTQGMYWDVTERKLAEEALRDLNETLERRVQERTRALRDANVQLARQKRELEEYASITAHDLKRPVVAMHGLLSMLDEEVSASISEEERENLTMAIAECRRMQQLVGDLSAVSRAERPLPRTQRVRIAEVVDACVRQLEVTIESHRARIEIDCPDDIHLVTSRWHFQEALTNLVENALVHGCPKPGMRVSIAARAQPDQVWIRVQDDGPGIPPEHHESIFELFRRVGDQGPDTGSGVGLCSVRRMIGSMGGAIFVESHPPGGAVFTIRLPVRQTASPALVTPPESDQGARAADGA